MILIPRDIVKFLDTSQTPMVSRGGWLVPVPGMKIDSEIMFIHLVKAGFKHKKDFLLQTLHSGSRDLKRVSFLTEEAFLMAKMTI